MSYEYIFITKTPQLSGRAREFGRNYRKMAILKVQAGTRPAMISERARGVVRICDVAVLHVGKTDRSYGFREMARMKAKVEELNMASELAKV